MAAEINPERERLEQLTQEFLAAAARRGLVGLEPYFWYHTVDLGGGLVTPGSYDFRDAWQQFGFPDDMRGLRILDVGSATGFFAFEFEKRGAEVTSVETPSLAALDVFPGESVQQTMAKLEKMLPSHSVHTSEQLDFLFHSCNSEDFYHYFIDGPFHFCRNVLGSRVERHYSTVYDLSEETLGGSGFDLVFMGDLLLHTLDPLAALAAVSRLCRGTLVISQGFPDVEGSLPAMLYVGGDIPGQDAISWWLPNLACLQDLLRKLGFREASLFGVCQGIVRPSGHRFTNGVVHASR